MEPKPNAVEHKPNTLELSWLAKAQYVQPGVWSHGTSMVIRLASMPGMRSPRWIIAPLRHYKHEAGVCYPTMWDAMRSLNGVQHRRIEG